MSRELLQQALDALETHVPHVYKDRGYPPIEALRAALAQPEPVDGFGGNLDEAFERAPVVREPLPEPVQRLMRFAGKKRNEVSNPCLTAREAIVIADWMQAHGIGGGGNG